MAESQDPDTEHSPYLRLPWPAAAAAIALLIVIVLGAGLYANRAGRPQLALQPVGPTRETAVIVTSQSPMNLRSTTIPTAATVAPQRVNPIKEAVTTPIVATVTPELAKEIGTAYEQYWQVRAEALLNLDTSRLNEVMAGEHLAAIQDRIAELRIDGQVIETDISHRYVVVSASATEAQVADSYVDQSVYLDQQSRSQISIPTTQVLREIYSLTKLDGTWRVVDLVRATS